MLRYELRQGAIRAAFDVKINITIALPGTLLGFGISWHV